MLFTSGSTELPKGVGICHRSVPEVTYANLYEPTEITDACTSYKVDRIFRDNDTLPIGKSIRNSEIMDPGRKDYQIKHMGHRIELDEIETAVSSLDGISRCCCLHNAEKSSIIMFALGELLNN